MIQGRGSWARCGRAVLAVGAVAFAVGGGAALATAETGTVVVRLAADPLPAGIDWSFTGVGPRFSLGSVASERRLEVEAGTYTLVEAGTRPGQPKTLTRLSCVDPTDNVKVDLAAASAAVDVGAGETVTCTFTHRALGPRPGSATVALARLYAPIFRLSSSEAYRPLRIEDYLGTTSLRSGSPPRGTLKEQLPTAFTLPLAAAKTYLDVRGAEPVRGSTAYPEIERRVEEATRRATVYWHVRREPSSDRVAIEFWLLYLYNAFYDRHEADWEGVTVVLQHGAPIAISFSQHQSRRWVAWSAQTKLATHPVVFVARGSHANYPRSSRYGVHVCWTLRVRACAPTTKRDEADGAGAKLDPELYDLHEFAGAPYRGGWGSGNYVLRVGLTRDRVTDPRVRLDYSSPFRSLPG